MSNEEFENYVALMGKLLRLTPEQREQISGELQDHLQMRVAELISEGVARPDAISQALEEFGDAAVMAQNFQTVLKLNRRRWMMRFATFSIAGAFLAAILTMAMWPDNARFGTPNKSMAQANVADEGKPDESDESLPYVSEATKRTLKAEEALREVVSLNFNERPFSEVEKQLKASTGLNFLLHSSARDDSLGEDEPLTFNLEGIPLNKALLLMLETKNATYAIDEGVIMIISLDDAPDEKWFRLKMYDCRELVNALSISPQSLGQNNRRSKPVQRDAETSGPESDLTDPRLGKTNDAMRVLAEKEHKLLDLVQNLIEPDSWQDTGQGLGQVRVVNGILVVSQTEAILQEIENFVADLEGNVLQKKKRGTRARTSSIKSERPARAKDPNEDPFGADAGEVGQDPFGADAGEYGQNPFGADTGEFGQDPFGADAGEYGEDPFCADAGEYSEDPFGTDAGEVGQDPFGK